MLVLGNPAFADGTQPVSSGVEPAPRENRDDFGTRLRTYLERNPDALIPHIESYLRTNPEILIEMSQTLQAREEAQQAIQRAQQAEDDKVLAPAQWPTLISDSSDGSIGTGEPAFVEFIDYNCGFCRRNHEHVNLWLQENPDRSAVIKEFPVLGEGSVAAARLALAIKALYGNEIYAVIHESLITSNERWTPASVDKLIMESFAGASKEIWDPDVIRNRMRSPEVDAKIELNRALATALGIRGTPTFVYAKGVGRGFQAFHQLDEGVSPAESES